ncbi:MAG: MiaB/RimO family radical SAM methylthiotransferase, partial [Chloroflexi bacterium]|nr:MiaB/RimO family radical SAM methylthiotransferase [Chloroflexota bacterium]
MNKADSKSLAGRLNELGYTEAESFEKADLIVLNSCAVRKSAEDRVFGRLGMLKQLKRTRPDTVIALMGCMVDADNRSLKKQYPHIDFFARPQEFEDILDIARLKFTVAEVKNTNVVINYTCAFITIMQGCNNYCSYCIVPYRRGRESSRLSSVIVKEIEQLADKGIREVTLLGQNVDAYGHDLKDGSDLAGLLIKINEIGKLSRIRFLTSHPRDMSDKLIDVIADLDKVCKHINLPVQSGDDEILKKMNRGYTSIQYRDLIRKIRTKIPGVAISTD